MNLLYKYLNGNVSVLLYEDGTKVMYGYGSEPLPVFPTSMDVKITNKCDLYCPFCHENSTENGKCGDLNYFSEYIKDLPNGTELALGGGNPLEHKDLLSFLKNCKSIGLVINLTINHKHIEKNIEFLNTLIDSKYIYGLGISIDDSFDFNILDKINNTSNVVFHVIAGVQDVSILDKIKNSKVNKVLILGYKIVGRGIKFHDDVVENKILNWKLNLKNYLRKMTLCFDNLALKLLEVNNLVNKQTWEKSYMGNDGQFTMYIDLVEKKYAVSSTSNEKFNIDSDIKTIFQNVRKLSGNIKLSEVENS